MNLINYLFYPIKMASILKDQWLQEVFYVCEIDSIHRFKINLFFFLLGA